MIEGLLADFPTTSREAVEVAALVAVDAPVECAMPTRKANVTVAITADSVTRRVAMMLDILVPATIPALAMPSREENAPEATLAAFPTELLMEVEVGDAPVECATHSRKANAIAALLAGSVTMARDLALSVLPALLAFAMLSRRESVTVATHAASPTSSVMCLRTLVLLVLVECAMHSREVSANVVRAADSVTRVPIKSPFLSLTWRSASALMSSKWIYYNIE